MRARGPRCSEGCWWSRPRPSGAHPTADPSAPRRTRRLGRKEGRSDRGQQASPVASRHERAEPGDRAERLDRVRARAAAIAASVRSSATACSSMRAARAASRRHARQRDEQRIRGRAARHRPEVGGRRDRRPTGRLGQVEHVQVGAALRAVPSEDHLALGPGQGDVEQPPLLGQLRRRLGVADWGTRPCSTPARWTTVGHSRPLAAWKVDPTLIVSPACSSVLIGASGVGASRRRKPVSTDLGIDGEVVVGESHESPRCCPCARCRPRGRVVAVGLPASSAVPTVPAPLSSSSRSWTAVSNRRCSTAASAGRPSPRAGRAGPALAAGPGRDTAGRGPAR